MGCKYRVMDKCRAKDNIKDAFCFGKDGCPYYEDEVEAIPKADYENRLKSDLVAMLTKLQLEIEELDNPLDYDFEGYNQCAVDCEKIIQQKINSLKEAKDGENND